MTTIPVILITVAGPAGHIDVGVRSDVSPAELAASLQEVIGTRPPWTGGEHRAPPRPGDPRGRRVPLRPGISLAEAGVTDGDLIVFADSGDYASASSYSATVTPARRPAAPPDSLPGPAAQLSAGGTRHELGGTRDARDELGGTGRQLGGTRDELGGTGRQLGGARDELGDARHQLGGARPEGGRGR